MARQPRLARRGRTQPDHMAQSDASCSLSLRERAGVRGPSLRSGAPPVPAARNPASVKMVLSRPLTPTLSRREKEPSTVLSRGVRHG